MTSTGADVDVRIGVAGDAAQESLVLRDLRDGPAVRIHAIDLSGFTAGVELAVGSPGDAFGVIQALVEVAGNRLNLGQIA